MSSSYRLELNRWLNNLEVSADKVLDIGGSQDPVNKRVRNWNVNKYLIADLPEPHKNSPEPDIEMDLNYLIVEEVEEYDLIFCLEVFDYIYDPVCAMINIGYLLKKDGIAWVTFPSIYPLHQPVEDDALRYMPSAIIKYARIANLTVESMIKRRPESNLWEQFYRTERMRAAKNEDHNFTGFIVEFKK